MTPTPPHLFAFPCLRHPSCTATTPSLKAPPPTSTANRRKAYKHTYTAVKYYSCIIIPRQTLFNHGHQHRVTHSPTIAEYIRRVALHNILDCSLSRVSATPDPASRGWREPPPAVIPSNAQRIFKLDEGHSEVSVETDVFVCYQVNLPYTYLDGKWLICVRTQRSSRGFESIATPCFRKDNRDVACQLFALEPRGEELAGGVSGGKLV